jgi:N-acetylglutamate synthase
MSGAPPLRRPQATRPRGSAGEDAGPPPSGAERMRIERQLALLGRHAGAQAEEVAELGGLAVTLPGRGPGYNFAACLRWPDDEVAERLRAARDWFSQRNEWPTLVLAEGLTEPPNLADLLPAAGWVMLERERIHATRQQPTVPHLSPSLRIEAVTSRTASECQQIEQAVFGLAERFTDARTEQLARAVATGALRAYLVRLDGRAVASARLSLSDGIAAVSAVGVVPEQRSQGFATLVTSVATRAGLAMGASLVWLSVDERNAPALRVYRRLGYEPSFGWSRWAAAATAR